ncbi:MAG: hypothetical protein ABIH23_10870, partial [bacterium]
MSRPTASRSSISPTEAITTPVPAFIRSASPGFDTDTPDVFDRSIEAPEKIKIDSVAVNILIPYPGTEFYRKFEREGRIICTD